MNSNNSLKTYCLVCKKLTENNNSETVKYKGRLMMKSTCPICGNNLGLNTPHNRMKNAS